MSSPLLATKLHLPLIRARHVKRDRLVALLNQAMKSPLILISAPAGFGKTTLLSEWLCQAKVPISWLSLDESDNDPKRFWTYVIAALQRTHPEIGESTLAILHSTESVSFETFLIPLINEISSLTDEIVLILDDYHVVTVHPIHEAIIFWLKHLPPQLHLAIASRVEPPLSLAQFRARGQLVELGSSDLRFTDAEAASFFNHTLKLPLSEEQVATMQRQTEGWIAELQLAALSMRDADDLAAFVASFKGTQRYILDYLAEEVLEHQPKYLQTFLLRTSVLERICGSLGEAVVGEPASAGSEILEQLERRNLFVVPLDQERTWYRYHHLFQELLRHFLDRAEPGQAAEYHRRAAHWFYQNGWVTEALQHSVAAQDFDWAADVIEQAAQMPNPRIEPGVLLS